MEEKSIYVAVRSRPLINRSDEVFNPGLTFSENEVGIQDKIFGFDYVFDPSSTNLKVYSTAVADRIPRIFEGYNLTIFAYGQTGSGKSFTMGTNYPPVLQNETGIILLSVTRIFEDIKKLEELFTFTVNVSFLEVYKEVVYDLLTNEKKPPMRQIREDNEGIKVVNLTEVPVYSFHDVLTVLQQGSLCRSTGSTAMNEHSSRSHSIFIVSIEQINKINFSTKKSKFQLVDLAGSERADQSKTEGLRFKEGVDINRGLLALGKVISGLSDGNSFISYRDSKLTRLLMDSLGGNSYTVMIACISPSLNSLDETISTLRYASRARKIKNRPVINNDPPDVQIRKLKEQIEILQMQLYRKDSLDGSKEYKEYSTLKAKLESSLCRITVLQENLRNVEKDYLDIIKEVYEMYQEIQSFIKKIDADHLSIPVTDMVLLLKNFEVKLQVLVSKVPPCSETVSLNAEASGSPPEAAGSPPEAVGSPPKAIGEIETSSDEDMDSVSDAERIDRKIQKVELQILENEEIAQQFEVLTSAIDNSFSTNEIQERINNLVKEQKELELKQLNDEKMALENWNKRLADCRSDIQKLKKQLLKTELFQQVKEKNRLKIESLQNEIKNLKSTKVKLQKKMKEENDRLRRVQTEKDKEIQKVKKNERKKDFENVKLKNTYDKKVNALTRKLETTQSRNKQLNETLLRLRQSRSKLNDRKTPKQNMEAWLNMEIEAEALKQMASSEYMDNKDRTYLCEGASNSQQVPNNVKDDPLMLLNQEVILGKQMLNSISEGNTMDKWRTLELVDTKKALSLLFEKCVQDYVKSRSESNSLEEEDLSDLRTDMEALKIEVCKLLSEKGELKQKLHNIQKEKVQQDIKIMEYLKRIKEGEQYARELHSDLEVSQCSLPQTDIFQFTKEDYIKLQQENEFLKEKLRMRTNSKRKYLTPFKSENQDPNIQEPKNIKSMVCEYLDDTDDDDYELGDDSFLYYDDGKDPDWRLTPLHKQKKRLRRSNEDEATKESSNMRLFCHCHGDCKTLRCSCRKKMKMCDPGCNCTQMCSNMSQDSIDESITSKQEK